MKLELPINPHTGEEYDEIRHDDWAGCARVVLARMCRQVEEYLTSYATPVALPTKTSMELPISRWNELLAALKEAQE